jgi:hypothetical protein
MRPHGTHGCATASGLCGYARALVGLCRGLDGALSATSARPAGQAARGFIFELLAWHPDWSSDWWQQSSGTVMMGHHAALQQTRRLKAAGEGMR